MSFKKYLQSILQSIVHKLENEKNHNNNDKHREENHPVIEPNVIYFFRKLFINC